MNFDPLSSTALTDLSQEFTSNKASALHDLSYYFAANFISDHWKARSIGASIGFDQTQSNDAFDKGFDIRSRLVYMMSDPAEIRSLELHDLLDDLEKVDPHLSSATICAFGDIVGCSPADASTPPPSGESEDTDPYTQSDSRLVIQGVPNDAKVTAFDTDGYPAALSVNRNNQTGTVTVDYLGANRGYVDIDVPNSNGNMDKGRYRLDFAGNVSTGGVIQFTNPFDGKGSHLPFGTYIFGNQDLQIQTREMQHLIKDAYNYGLAHNYNAYNLKAVIEGNYYNQAALSTWYSKTYIHPLIKMDVTGKINYLERQFKLHVTSKNPWSTKDVQDVFRTGIVLSTFLATTDEKTYITKLKADIASYGQPSVERQDGLYRAAVAAVLKTFVSTAEIEHIIETLVSAVLSKEFDTLERASSDPTTTKNNAISVIEAFSPHAAVASAELKTMQHLTAKDAMISKDPNAISLYATRKLLTIDPATLPAVDSATTKEIAKMSAAVYAVGAIRELLPIFKTLGISQMQEQNAAKTLESFLVVDAANRMKYVVPPYKRQTFSQDYLGAFEAACLRNGIYFNTQEWGIVHTMLRKIKPYFDQTDLILPIISLALRATKSFMGIPTWNWQQQALNALRIAGDALAIANWVHKFGRSRIVANSLSTTPTNILGFHNYMSIVGEFVRIGAFTAGFELGANLINYGVPMIARFMENVVEVGVDLADVFYGTANFAEGAIETAKRGDLTHSIPLSSYGLLNAVSGLAFTLDGIDVIHGRWVKPMKSVSIGFQLGATAFCGYFVSYSINHS